MDEPSPPAEQPDAPTDSGDPLRRAITQAVAIDAGEGMMPGGWVLLYTVMDSEGEERLRLITDSMTQWTMRGAMFEALYGGLEEQEWRHRDDDEEEDD